MRMHMKRRSEATCQFNALIPHELHDRLWKLRERTGQPLTNIAIAGLERFANELEAELAVLDGE